MNKFNLGLHKALFTENGREAPSDLLKPIDFELKSEVIIPTQKELKPLKTSLNQVEQKIQDAMSDFDTEYYNFANKVGIEVQQSRKESKTLTNEQLNRVRNRHKELTLEWNGNVRAGYEDLLRALTRKGYFIGPKAKSPKEVQEKYMDVVSKQYENYVWDANDETFDSVKESLFTKGMGVDYPANVVFCDLTGAQSMFTFDRRAIEGRGMKDLSAKPVESENAEGDTAEVETMSDRRNKDFLSKVLTKYLWDVKVTPEALEDYNLLIVSKNTDRPSDLDRDAIAGFVEASNKITVSGDKDPALALLEAFRDNRINTDSTRDVYKYVLEEHGIELKKDRYLNDIVNAGNFYIATQIEGNSERNQHAIYLNVLKIIEEEGGVAKAANKFRPIVEQERVVRKQEKIEKFESGDRLQTENPELYDFANKLGVADFARVRRLARKDADYFAKTNVGDILANVNNDDKINGKDIIAGGLKSGLEFRSILEQVGEEKALSNLLERAKIINGVSQYGLDESKITKEEIQGGNLELVLLLQDIISKPGEDLYRLLSGAKGEAAEGEAASEKLNEIEEDGKLREKAFEEAGKILTEKAFLEEYEEMFKGKDNVHVENFADLQASLASCLYDNYKTGVGFGSSYSFDDWVKGLQISAGAQIRGDGAVLGLNISYDTTQNLGNGWTMTEGVSAGAFLPIVSGDPDAFISAGVHIDLDKKTVEWDTGKAHHAGFDLGYNVVTNTLYGGRHHRWDKVEAIPEAARYHAEKFEKEIMWRMLDDIKAELGESKMDLSVKEVSDKVRNVISKIVAEQPDIKEGDREKVVNGMMRSLTSYNNVDLNQPGMKYVIAEEIAKQYELAWSENQKMEASKGAYFSGYSLGLFWMVGTTKGGAYATLEFKKHRMDGNGDKYGKAFEISSENISEWTEDALDMFNNELGLSGDNKLRLENGFVVIPASITYKVNVNEKMKGLMKKGDNGDILIDTHTPMSSDSLEGTQTISRELMIGGNKGEKWEKLDKVSREGVWFAEEINQDAVSELGEKVDVYNVDGLNKALDDLKKKFPAGDPIQDFEFDAPVATLLLQGLQSENKSKLIMSKTEEGHWKFDYADGDGENLEIEYQARFEMIDRKARDIANAVYAEALKINGNDNRVLHSVKHNGGWPEYGEFSGAMQAKDYNAAREAIKPIFTKLDSKINGANFGSIGSALDDITDNDALGQALMSINNVFARSVKVVGGGDEYEFKDYESKPMSMGTIIAEREGQISRTIEDFDGKKMSAEVKAAYKSLIDASSKFRQQNKDLFNKKNAPAAQLKNTVGFNLGDKTNPENPLFNPEIYDPMVDLKELEKYGFNESTRGVLQERAMRLFAGNEALINPVKKYLGLDENTEVKVVEDSFSMDGERGKLKLDIGGKIITLSGGMKFGYFTQCVNHTVILDDISVETEDGTKVTFASDVWENGTMKESAVSRIVSTTKVSLGLSVAFGGEKEEEEPAQDTETDPEANKRPKPNGGSTPGADDGGSTGAGGTAGQGTGGQGGSQGGGRNGEGNTEGGGSSSGGGTGSGSGGGEIPGTTTGSGQTGGGGGNGRG